MLSIKMNCKFGTKLFTDKQNNVTLYRSSIKHVGMLVQRWYQNRPEDATRVNEIANGMRNSTDTLIDNVIYAWWHDKKLHVYDGWTRWCAGYSLLSSDKRDMQIILSVNTSPTEEPIIKHFERLNKAVPVPHLYTTTTSPVRRLMIETIVSEIQKQYPKFISTARRPRKPHCNRDQMIEILDTSLPDPLGELKFDTIMRYLKEINEALLRDLPRSELPDKAVDHGFALFCISTDDLAQRIRDKTIKQEIDLGGEEVVVDLLSF